MKRRRAILRWCGGAFAALFAAGMVGAADGVIGPITPSAGEAPAPSRARLYAQGSGRFEVVAEAGEDGERLARLAEEAWEAWRLPLALPDRLPVAITVRLSPADQWGFEEPWWRVAGEPGAVVSVWIRGGGASDAARDRRWLTALAQGVLHRRAMSLGVGPDRLVVPHWVATGAAQAAMARTSPAFFDAWQQAAITGARMPSLRTTLEWTGAQQTSPEEDLRRVAAFGVWQWLQAGAGRTTAWRRFIEALLGGAAPGAALVGSYPEQMGRSGAVDIELAWQTGVAWMARAGASPMFTAEETRRYLEEADRLVVADPVNGEEQVLRLGELWLERRNVFVAAEREARIAWLTANFARMHPFYRNASGSLGRVLVAQSEGDAAVWSASLMDWHRDLATGRELEQASTALLNAAERGAP